MGRIRILPFLLLPLTSPVSSQPSDWTVPGGTGTTVQLTDVGFSSRLAGWAVGYDGTILRSTDGGATWTSQYFEVSLVLRDLCVLDSLHAWAIGRNSIPGYVPRVFYTVNGGLNWFGRMSGAEYGVHFVSATAGWAVGNGGAVRISTDGGDNWNSQVSNTGRLLRSVYFHDASTGWCAGDSGAVIRTTNGGGNWIVCPVPVSVALRGIHFASPTVGWAVGDYGTVLRSTDGGASWASQTTGTSAKLNAVRAVDGSTVLAAGEDGLVLKSTDAGLTWKGQRTGTLQTLNGLGFFDHLYGWAVGAGGVSIATTNGGGTADLTPPALLEPGEMETVAGTDPQFRWGGVAGAASYALRAGLNREMTQGLQQLNGLVDTTGRLAGLQGDTLYYWRAGAVFGAGPRFWSLQRVFRTGVTLPASPVLVYPERYEKPVSTTTRLAWMKSRMATQYHLQVADNVSFIQPEVDQSGIADTAYSVSGLANSEMYFWRVAAANSAGESPFSSFWSFTTEGIAWKRVAQEILAGPVSAWFVNRNFGLVGGRSDFGPSTSPVLWKTTDGGDLWRAIPLPGLRSHEKVNDLTFTDSLAGFFVSDYGAVFKSTDGGETWTRKTADSWWSGTSIDFVSSRAGWALINNGKVLRTTDAGETWTDVYSGSNLWRFDFVDSLHGWIAAGKVVHRTTDGGLSWSVDSLRIPPSIQVVRGMTPQIVYGGGSATSVMKSTDAGVTWSYQSLTSDSWTPIYCLSFVDSITMLAAGDLGLIFITTDGGARWTESDNLEAGGSHYSRIMMVDRQVGWAVLDHKALMKTKTGGLLTALGGEEESRIPIPWIYQLDQNFPNPFNPSTTIRFGLPVRSHVTLAVFSILGQSVRVLVDGELDAGYHEARLDASGLASGVYLCRLNAGRFVDTRRMLLLR